MKPMSALNKSRIRAFRRLLSEPAVTDIASTGQGATTLSKVYQCVVGWLREDDTERMLAQLPSELRRNLPQRKHGKDDGMPQLRSLLRIGIMGAAITGFMGLLVGGIRSVLENWNLWSSDISLEELQKVRATAEASGQDVDRAQLEYIKSKNQNAYQQILDRTKTQRAAELPEGPDGVRQASMEVDAYASQSPAEVRTRSPAVSKTVQRMGGVEEVAQELKLTKSATPQTDQGFRPTVAAKQVKVKTLEPDEAVRKALEFAARIVGVPLWLLYAIAHKESALGRNTEAKTSSAKGLFQFIRSTWAGMVKKYGKTVPGLNFGIDDRTKVGPSALAGAFYVRDNIEALRKSGISKIGATEVYFAHFLGPGQAARFLRLIGSGKGEERADFHFPDQAKANRPVFYENGNLSIPRTLNQLYAYFGSSMSALESAYASALESSRVPEQTAEQYARYQGPTRNTVRLSVQTETKSPSKDGPLIVAQGMPDKQLRPRQVGTSVDPSSGLTVVSVHEFVS